MNSHSTPLDFDRCWPLAPALVVLLAVVAILRLASEQSNPVSPPCHGSNQVNAIKASTVRVDESSVEASLCEIEHPATPREGR
jgi:hypothetical protein